MRSCFDGVIYTEECRDYREEMCVESSGTATCRTNRWQDCVLQTDKKNCLDDSKRDCYWDEGLKKSYNSGYEGKKCYPTVPPGFKHWIGNGIKFARWQMSRMIAMESLARKFGSTVLLNIVQQWETVEHGEILQMSNQQADT
jgi:hypothetical protein